jgi:hypothetical protein
MGKDLRLGWFLKTMSYGLPHEVYIPELTFRVAVETRMGGAVYVLTGGGLFSSSAFLLLASAP